MIILSLDVVCIWMKLFITVDFIFISTALPPEWLLPSHSNTDSLKFFGRCVLVTLTFYSKVRINPLSWIRFFLNFSIKSWSNFKIRDSFEKLRTCRFQNCPWFWNLTKIWWRNWGKTGSNCPVWFRLCCTPTAWMHMTTAQMSTPAALTKDNN